MKKASKCLFKPLMFDDTLLIFLYKALRMVFIILKNAIVMGDGIGKVPGMPTG